AEIARLRQALEESQETVRAIRNGEVDAVIVEGADESKVFTLGAAEQTYQFIVNQVVHPAAVLTLDGHIRQANAAFAKLVHMEPQDLHDVALESMVSAGSVRSLQGLIAQGLRSETTRDLILKTAEGLNVPVSFAVQPLEDSPAGPCLLLTDLTAQLLHDKILSEELLAQSVLEQVADAVVVCDAGGRIVRASRAVESLTGSDPRHMRFDDAFPLRQADEAGRSGKARPLTFDAILAAPDMRRREVLFTRGQHDAHLLLSAGFLYGTDGAVRGAVITLTDITERKRVESALELADTRKNEFLAILAHELRNPLAPIANSIHILSMDLAPDIHVQALGMMDRQVRQMIRLVDDLMDVSRITRGRIELKTERLKLADILSAAAETSEPLIAQFRHRLDLALPGPDVQVEGDFTRLTQVFSNLLNNAAKYSESGRAIRVTTEVSGGHAIVTVADQGIGVASEMLERIFDMFAQADDSLERSHGGLGVGLTLVRNLVEKHHGRIEAKSGGLGQGSQFVVTLPVIPAAAEEISQMAEEKSPEPGDGLRVLIVEDNEALAKTTGWLVEALGYDYRLAHNGAEALAVAADYRPQVVMMDIGLPGMNGYDLCRAMRAEPHLEETVFIAQTGWGQSEHRQMAQEAGFHHHMVKPVDFNRLQDMLASITAA
ncbi:MAG: ATP-binding protein, partial [Asticcacaulis sp.]